MKALALILKRAAIVCLGLGALMFLSSFAEHAPRSASTSVFCKDKGGKRVCLAAHERYQNPAHAQGFFM